jgi:hypothetical protein
MMETETDSETSDNDAIFKELESEKTSLVVDWLEVCSIDLLGFEAFRSICCLRLQLIRNLGSFLIWLLQWLIPGYLEASSFSWISLQRLWTLAVFHFPDLFTIGRTPWMSNQLVTRFLPKHRTAQTQNNHMYTRNIHTLSGIRTHDHRVRASEDGSCLRPLSYRDWHLRLCSIER